MKKLALLISAFVFVLIGVGVWLLGGTDGDKVQRDEVRIDISQKIEQ